MVDRLFGLVRTLARSVCRPLRYIERDARYVRVEWLFHPRGLLVQPLFYDLINRSLRKQDMICYLFVSFRSDQVCAITGQSSRSDGLFDALNGASARTSCKPKLSMRLS